VNDRELDEKSLIQLVNSGSCIATSATLRSRAAGTYTYLTTQVQLGYLFDHREWSFS